MTQDRSQSGERVAARLDGWVGGWEKDVTKEEGAKEYKKEKTSQISKKQKTCSTMT